MRRVVVTGCGAVSPLGVGLEKTWQNLIAGKSGIDKITFFDASAFDAQIAGEVKDFDPLKYLNIKEARRTARFVQFSLAAAKEAVENSGLDLSKYDPYRIAVIIGSGIGSLDTVEKELKVYFEKGPRRISPFLIPMMITNEAAGSVAIQFNAKGPNFCTVTACASGAHAIGEAFRLIQHGYADIVICGGTESTITPMGIGGFCALKALSTNNECPQKASRPFDKNRDGFVMAEGAGIVVLENYEFARQRNANIYAEVAGYSANCDAYHITAPDPEGKAAAEAMKQAFKEAGGFFPSAVYINAHGTSTPLNDKMETQAIKRAFGSDAKAIHISSTKSMIGHTLGAAGALEFIFSVYALNQGIIPPTINYETPDPECDLDYTPNEALKLDLDFALSNSLGFGGHNATLALKKI